MIANIYDAMQHFRQVVHELEGINVLQASQPFKYCYLCHTVDFLKDPDVVGSFFVFLKRAHFQTFNKQFDHLPAEYKGLGQTITLDALKRAADTPNSYIIIVMQEGQIYWIRAKIWYEWATMYKTIRAASNSADGNLEASIPLKLLKRLNP